jgi:hypothetical protein
VVLKSRSVLAKVKSVVISEHISSKENHIDKGSWIIVICVRQRHALPEQYIVEELLVISK